MQNFNKDGFGQKLYINFNQDVSTATAFEVKLQPEVGQTLERTGVLETSDLYVGDEKYLANEFVSYTIQDGDFTQTDDLGTPSFTKVGRWRAKCVATLPGSTIATDFELFRVTT